MIELPEAQVLASQVNEILVGKCVADIVANSSPHRFAWYEGNPDEYGAKAAGKCVTGARGLGGTLEIFLEDYRLTFSDGAKPRYYGENEEKPKKHQLLISFDDGSAVGVGVQMYGGMLLFKDGECDNPYYINSRNSLNFLADEYDYKKFRSLYTDKMNKLSLKAFLATEQRIPGLGNGVLQDILFNARLHPKKKMGTLTESDFEAVFTGAKKTLSDMMLKGGRDVEKDLLGCDGGYKTILSKNTLSKPCPICGGVLKKEAYMGGVIYFCENCQKL